MWPILLPLITLFALPSFGQATYHCRTLEKCKEAIRGSFKNDIRDPSKRVVLIQNFRYEGPEKEFIPNTIYREEVLQEGSPGAQLITITQSGIIPNKRGLYDEKYLSFFVSDIRVDRQAAPHDTPGPEKSLMGAMSALQNAQPPAPSVSCDSCATGESDLRKKALAARVEPLIEPSTDRTGNTGKTPDADEVPTSVTIDGKVYKKEEVDRIKPSVLRPRYYGGQSSILNLSEVKKSVAVIAAYLRMNPDKTVVLTGHICSKGNDLQGTGEKVWNYRDGWESAKKIYAFEMDRYQSLMKIYDEELALYRSGKSSYKPTEPGKPEAPESTAGKFDYTWGMLMLERARSIKLLLLEDGVPNAQVEVMCGSALPDDENRKVTVSYRSLRNPLPAPNK